MKIKILEKVVLIFTHSVVRWQRYQLPDLEPPEQEETEQFKYILFFLGWSSRDLF